MFKQILTNFKMGQTIKANEYSPLALAHIGDSVFELYVRTYIMKDNNTHVDKLHRLTTGYVNCKAQAEALRRIEPQLTEEELRIYKRGRNTNSRVPKNADLADYKAATGFEALLGYLYIDGGFDRLIYLLGECVDCSKL